MKNIYYGMMAVFALLFLLFFSGCGKVEQCDSGIYTTEGKCCNHICKLHCPEGYVEGTCNCECIETTTTELDEDQGGDGGSNVEDIGIDDIFEDSNDVEPPSIPA